MKKLFGFIIIVILILQSCTKNSDIKTETMVRDDIRPPYTVKYEVQFSTNQVRGTTFIQYSHESNGRFNHWSEPSGGLVYLTNSSLNSVWSYSFLVTVSTNPLPLEIQTNFNPTSNAIAYFKIYVDNILVKNTQVNVSPNNSSTNFINSVRYDVY